MISAAFPYQKQHRRVLGSEMAEYRRPFAAPGEGRRPTLTWPRQIPIEGEPADVTAIAAAYADWLANERHTLAVREGRTRFARRRRRESRLRLRVPSADRGDGRGAPFPPGGFAGRDWTGHRRLDEGGQLDWNSRWTRSVMNRWSIGSARTVNSLSSNSMPKA